MNIKNVFPHLKTSSKDNLLFIAKMIVMYWGRITYIEVKRMTVLAQRQAGGGK